MSPPLLKLLCEGEGIWNGHPEDTEEDEARRDDNAESLAVETKDSSPVSSDEEADANVTDASIKEMREADTTDVEAPVRVPRQDEHFGREAVPTLVVCDGELEGYSPFQLADPEGSSGLDEKLKEVMGKEKDVLGYEPDRDLPWSRLLV